MGGGCDVAKDASDMIITNGSFDAILKSIKWGRALYNNVKSFLTFQLTVNIVLCFVTILGGMTQGRTPLNVVQMLWANLIMDILAAITLGTESFRDGEVDARISRKEKMLNQLMWRNILCMSLYQILVMIILMYFGGLMFFDGFNLITTPLRNPETNEATNRMALDTIIFNTFILMTLCNQINCKVGTFTINNLISNPIFWSVFLIECVVQFFMITAGNTNLGQALLGTTGLTMGQHIFCILMGLSVIPLQYVFSITVDEKAFSSITKNINLETEDPDSGISKLIKGMEDYKQKVLDHLAKKDDKPSGQA